MKDFISKLTFGFIMAQLVPGVVVVYSLSILYLSLNNAVTFCLHDALSPINIWLTSNTHLLVFIALSIAAGLAIHGLHWAVLGFLEKHNAEKDEQGNVMLKSVSESFWHDKPIAVQMALGPVKIAVEIFLLLFRAKGIEAVSLEENVSFIPKDRIEAFNFLQDFYLHFAQFYAHVSYALAFMFWMLVMSIAAGSALSFNVSSISVLVIIWLASGCFFIISRIQFTSLFAAEWDMRGAKQ